MFGDNYLSRQILTEESVSTKYVGPHLSMRFTPKNGRMSESPQVSTFCHSSVTLNFDVHHTKIHVRSGAVIDFVCTRFSVIDSRAELFELLTGIKRYVFTPNSYK